VLSGFADGLSISVADPGASPTPPTLPLQLSSSFCAFLIREGGSQMALRRRGGGGKSRGRRRRKDAAIRD